jgi:uncharacterized membrane protein
MLKYIFYPMFGLGVVGAYGVTAATATDVTSVQTQRSTVPMEYRQSYNAAPIIWRTGFHGPRAYQPTYSSSSSGSSSGGGGFYYGGSGGGGGGFGGFGGK